jgi:hypothetical protein
MKAVLKILNSYSVDDLEFFVPSDPEFFGVPISASFGIEGEPGADLFSLTVCTPSWLEDLARRETGILVGRHFLIVLKYDFRRIKRFLESYADKCEGDAWPAIAEKLGRLGHWEFEENDPGSTDH